MSYTSITIGGKSRGIKFNQMAVIVMAQKCDPDNYAASAAYAMVYAGLKANCYVKSEEPDFTFEQVCDWVELISPEDLAKVVAAMQECEAYKKLVPEEKEPAKKKQKIMPMKP